MDAHFLDTFSLPQLLLGSMLLMLLFLELGYRIASRPTLKAAKAQVSQVRALMGAALALAFWLVLVLIVDLDRPLMTLFHMDNHVMLDLLEQMKSDSGPGSRQGARG